MSNIKSTQGLQTKAIHAGESPQQQSKASAPPICMSSTFIVDEPVSFSANNLQPDSPLIYTRWANPTSAQLEVKLAALENAESCVAFSSGMAASSSILLSLLSRGDHVVISNTNYPGTAEVARDTLPRFGIEATPVDTSSLDDIKAAIKPNTKMIWAETPSNPLLRITDIKATAEMAHQQDALLVIDSTFATPVATKPLDLGADLVMHSLTKYIGGHGDAVGGAVAGRMELIRQLRLEAGIHHGGILSPFNAWLIARGASTLPLRLKAHQAGAQAVAEWLEGQSAVTRVIYPGLPSHPQYALAQRQMSNTSGMIAFQVGDVAQGEEIARRMIDRLQIIHYAVSLGHHRSLIFWMETAGLMNTSFRLTGPQAESYRAFAGDGIFRLSVGLEDAEDLIADLDRVL